MLIIDPGAEAQGLITVIEQEKLKPVAVLLTHGHFDHATDAAILAEKYQIRFMPMSAKGDFGRSETQLKWMEWKGSFLSCGLLFKR